MRGLRISQEVKVRKIKTIKVFQKEDEKWSVARNIKIKSLINCYFYISTTCFFTESAEFIVQLADRIPKLVLSMIVNPPDKFSLNLVCEILSRKCNDLDIIGPNVYAISDVERLVKVRNH